MLHYTYIIVIFILSCSPIAIPLLLLVSYFTSPGVFNLSDNAGHINNCNDARGPLSYIMVFTCNCKLLSRFTKNAVHMILYNVKYIF